jgi:hypothetical protein
VGMAIFHQKFLDGACPPPPTSSRAGASVGLWVLTLRVCERSVFRVADVQDDFGQAGGHQGHGVGRRRLSPQSHLDAVRDLTHARGCPCGVPQRLTVGVWAWAGTTTSLAYWTKRFRWKRRNLGKSLRTICARMAATCLSPRRTKSATCSTCSQLAREEGRPTLP